MNNKWASEVKGHFIEEEQMTSKYRKKYLSLDKCKLKQN